MVVADVHTAPTDAAGNLIGHVLHAGTGPLDPGIVITECHDETPDGLHRRGDELLRACDGEFQAVDG